MSYKQSPDIGILIAGAQDNDLDLSHHFRVIDRYKVTPAPPPSPATLRYRERLAQYSASHPQIKPGNRLKIGVCVAGFPDFDVAALFGPFDNTTPPTYGH